MSIKDNIRKTRSPLKERPLRAPGDSLRAAADKLITDTLLPWLFVAAVFVLWAMLEWYRYLTSFKPSPWLFTVCAVAAVVVAVRKMILTRRLVENIGLGFEGEKVVGQSLEHLRADGYQVFHDIEEDGYNIDHVVIGPKGVFAIETKTVSKEIGHAAEVVYDGKTVIVDGHSPDRDPLKQAQASADRVSEILRQNTGHDVFVRPVVLYPGWWVTRRCRKEKVWVLNPNALPSFLDREDKVLAGEQVQLYSTAMASHVRSGS